VSRDDDSCVWAEKLVPRLLEVGAHHCHRRLRIPTERPREAVERAANDGEACGIVLPRGPGQRIGESIEIVKLVEDDVAAYLISAIALGGSPTFARRG
jgi:hypothetical protein